MKLPFLCRLFLCLALPALLSRGADIPGTVILNPITLGSDAAVTGITNKHIGDTSEMKGTPKQVADITARNAIPAARRKEGMECWVISEGKVHRLVGGILNANWAEVLSGSGSATNAIGNLNGTGTNTAFEATSDGAFDASVTIYPARDNIASSGLNIIARGPLGAAIGHYEIEGGKSVDSGVWGTNFGSGFAGNWIFDIYHRYNPVTEYGPSMIWRLSGNYPPDLSGEFHQHDVMMLDSTNGTFTLFNHSPTAIFGAPKFRFNWTNGVELIEGPKFIVNSNGVERLEASAPALVACTGTIGITNGVATGVGTVFATELSLGSVLHSGTNLVGLVYQIVNNTSAKVADLGNQITNLNWPSGLAFSNAASSAHYYSINGSPVGQTAFTSAGNPMTSFIGGAPTTLLNSGTMLWGLQVGPTQINIHSWNNNANPFYVHWSAPDSSFGVLADGSPSVPILGTASATNIVGANANGTMRKLPIGSGLSIAADGTLSAAGTGIAEVNGTGTNLFVFTTNGFAGPGTASATANTATGSSTTFLSTFQLGDKIFFGGNGATVRSVESDTSMTLFEPLENSSASYDVHKASFTAYGINGEPALAIDAAGAVNLFDTAVSLWRFNRWSLGSGVNDEFIVSDLLNTSNPLIIQTNGSVNVLSNVVVSGGGTGLPGLTVGGNVLAVTNGNVGIGTTNPLAPLHVTGANQATGGDYNTYGNLFISSTDALDADKGGAISFGGTGNSGGVLTYTFGRITGKKENATGGNTAGYLAFETDSNASSTLVERMRLTSTGSVGIGETAPASKLSVSGNLSVGSGYDTTAAPANGAIIEGNVGIGTSPDYKLHVLSGSGTAAALLQNAATDSKLYIGEGNGVSQYGILGWSIVDNYTYLDSHGSTHLVLQSGNEGSGNVGIGTVSPDEKLEVNGNVLADSFGNDGINFVIFPPAAATNNHVLAADGTTGQLKWSPAGGSGSTTNRFYEAGEAFHWVELGGTNGDPYAIKGSVASATVPDWTITYSGNVESIANFIADGSVTLSGVFGGGLSMPFASAAVMGSVSGLTVGQSIRVDAAGTGFEAYSTLTNTAQFDTDNADIVLGTAYTNSARRLQVFGSFQLNAAAAGTAKVTVYSILGTTTNKLTISAGPLASLTTTEPLTMRVQPGGYYYYADETSGTGASATVVAGTHSRFWE